MADILKPVWVEIFWHINEKSETRITFSESKVGGQTLREGAIYWGWLGNYNKGVQGERQKRFHATFSQYMIMNHLEEISRNEIGNVVNRGNTHDPFTQDEITCLLQRLETPNRLMIVNQVVHLVWMIAYVKPNQHSV